MPLCENSILFLWELFFPKGEAMVGKHIGIQARRPFSCRRTPTLTNPQSSYEGCFWSHTWAAQALANVTVVFYEKVLITRWWLMGSLCGALPSARGARFRLLRDSLGKVSWAGQRTWHSGLGPYLVSCLPPPGPS